MVTCSTLLVAACAEDNPKMPLLPSTNGKIANLVIWLSGDNTLPWPVETGESVNCAFIHHSLAIKSIMAATHWVKAQNSNYLRDITVAVLHIFGNKCF